MSPAHEMGHNVEQTFTLNDVDHIFAERRTQHRFYGSIGFRVSGARSGTSRPSGARRQSEAEKDLNNFWATFEIAGVALVDMAVWHWMYDHPAGLAAGTKPGHGADFQGHVEPVLRSGVSQE